TFARAALDEINVQNNHLAPTIGDQSFRLQLFCNATHACSLHAHHLCQKVLCQRQFSAGEIVHPHEPLTHALFDIVDGVAGRRLLHLAEQNCSYLMSKERKSEEDCATALRWS